MGAPFISYASNKDFLNAAVSVESHNTSRKIIPGKFYNLFFPYTFIEFFIGFQSEFLDRIEQKILIVLFARIVKLDSVVYKIVDEVEFPPICILEDEFPVIVLKLSDSFT